jgi:hypothetical protein
VCLFRFVSFIPSHIPCPVSQHGTNRAQAGGSIFFVTRHTLFTRRSRYRSGCGQVFVKYYHVTG